LAVLLAPVVLPADVSGLVVVQGLVLRPYRADTQRLSAGLLAE